MITALNGILIVAMLFAFGLYHGDRWLILASLMSATFSWVTNVAREIDMRALALPMAVASIVSAAAGILRMYILI